MPLDPSNFEYPHRSYGMDHDRYDWSLLQRRPRFDWPGGKTIALWITVPVEIFPLDDTGEPFKLPGALKKPYPDIQTYTWRDYGNRVGIYRMMREFDAFAIKPTWAINGAVAQDIPSLMQDIVSREEDIIAHGWDMASPHYEGLAETEEKALVDRTLSALSAYARAPTTCWMSPGKAQSARTPELLAQAGLSAMCDWPNDDMPYAFRTAKGPLIALPHSTDLDDRKIIVDDKHDEARFVEQVKDQFSYLSREAKNQGGRIVSLNLHPWVIGQSHRALYLRQLLAFFAERENVFVASASEITHIWQAAQTG